MSEEIGRASVSRRRRKSRHVQRAGFGALLAHRHFAVWLFLAMCVLAAIYASVVLYRVRTATQFYHDVTVGMSTDEVRYMLGAPGAALDDGQRWRYGEDGRQIDVSFGPDRRMASISCSDTEGGRYGCPGILGISTGTTEDAVWLKLGPPGRESYSGNDKTIAYPDLGMTFLLRRYRVVAMKLARPSGSLSFVPRSLWAMIP